MKPKRVKRPLDGVLLLDKALGLTSNAALLQCRRLFEAESAGHTGTLDPLASGLLPVCFGEATKFSAGLLDADKEYEAVVRFGERTATGDAEGPIIATSPVNVSTNGLEAALARFRGAISQVPPMHSALKRDGKPLYAYAREGKEVERAPRNVTIHRLDLLGFDGRGARIRVLCSKGTYIRVLAEDIGAAIGCGAHLASLRRTAIGPYGIERAIPFVRLEGLDRQGRDSLLMPLDTLVSTLPEVRLDAPQERRFVQGQALPWPDGAEGVVRVYAAAGSFLGIATRGPGAVLRPKRLISL